MSAKTTDKNPMEGKKVIFVESPDDPQNADGVCGHLEAVGSSRHKPGVYEAVFKRALDILLSGVGGVLLSPVYIAFIVAILIDDPGPVFFAQKRIGKDKRYFNLHKFRSMKMSTPHDVPTHMLDDPEQYITRVGRFMRRTSIDELPQLWDIFTGKMSVVGPRPALWNQDVLVAERDKYGANDIKPGLTGWAQINGRDELEIPDKARLDGEYVDKMSFAFDLKCFFGTFLSVAKSEGVVEGGTGELHKNGPSIVVLSSHTPSLFWFRIEMMQEFIRRGYTVYALGNEEEALWADRFKEKGVIYEQIPVRRNGLNPLQDRQTLKGIRKKLRRIKPVKIFAYQAKTVIYGAMAANSLGITEVYPLIAGMGTIFISDDLKSRLIRVVMTFLYKRAMKACPAVFFQNRDDEEIFRRLKIVTSQKVVLLHGSGVNTERFAVSELPEKPSFICISRLIRSKGVYEYLEACRLIRKEYPDARCLLVGPYDTNPSALKPEELAPFTDGGIVEYFGEQEDVRPYIAQACVSVLPSYREGTPKVNLEAMACGRAVITTDAPGCRETVVDGENGFLVPVGDVDALYRKMKYFIDNPVAARAMGLKGRKMVEEIFDVAKVNETICKTMGI